MVQYLKFSALPAHKNSRLAGCRQSVFDGSLPSTLGLRNRLGSVPIHFPYNKTYKNKSHKVRSHGLASHSQSPCLEMTRSGNCSGNTATASRKL